MKHKKFYSAISAVIIILCTLAYTESELPEPHDNLLSLMKIPGFEYGVPWLIKEMMKRGFKRKETEIAIKNLKTRNYLDTTQNTVILLKSK